MEVKMMESLKKKKKQSLEPRKMLENCLSLVDVLYPSSKLTSDLKEYNFAYDEVVEDQLKTLQDGLEESRGMTEVNMGVRLKNSLLAS